ncbi:negative regulator for alginate biosynthesis MucB [Halomonas sp. MCCC 1A17488]|uniref:Negative regulator for alginate biosynthesis MucB n=1 Tax=Billgrantia sulfidoxydans TaxID=2733484 RepID=A0ABX7W6J6_9GAMM|nr:MULTISPECIES: MucB/RseB C-terminal domain-containing protein [Halomonas]MCE8015626.1 negative regulator for alginate biosynthesis MucB [Halomonas sp. MCCC 1A17488]MCG3238959.1 negative regulator for alginate biosynthesis MucB [Halomonas sp. MCCC 1A17488]QPP51088.1 MucB/RseB C-terminal domain-containing protein [Halomonas sp. SS10-MC5]QTP54599.1 negative regulator for alginate biosynthesis MucB [Halomonas sulfidoxydans]
MAGRRIARRLALLSSAALLTHLSPVVAEAPAGQADAGRFDCRQLADWEPPETPLEWFERSLWANHCLVFQARAVRIGIDGVRTLALSRDIQDGVEREVARFLDGPPVFFERSGHISRMNWSSADESAPASPAGIARHVDQYYRLSLGNDERIANRGAVRLDIEPLDGMRFGQRLWLDAQTSLPLKRELIDDRGRVVETFQFTELQSPRLHEGGVILEDYREPPRQSWFPTWLPDGFVDQPIGSEAEPQDRERPVGHRIYSDGLSTLSLFVEPIEEGHERLIPGLHRLGISLAVVRHVVADERPHQVVVMGELPPRVLVQVAENLAWRESPE